MDIPERGKLRKEPAFNDNGMIARTGKLRNTNTLPHRI
jgi:hypothetical protein